jgi:hypothetical protein
VVACLVLDEDRHVVADRTVKVTVNLVDGAFDGVRGHVRESFGQTVADTVHSIHLVCAGVHAPTVRVWTRAEQVRLATAPAPPGSSPTLLLNAT